MTKEEARKIYKEISSKLKLTFTSYYKYTFTFSGSVCDVEVSVLYGGNNDWIYRYDVDNEPFKAPETFDDLMDQYYMVIIKKGEDVFEDYHYE